MNILVWTIDSRYFGCDITKVARTISAVEIVPLPNTPNYISGAINLHGKTIPVFDMRMILGIPKKELEVSDHFILCSTQEKEFALLVDGVDKVKSWSGDKASLSKNHIMGVKDVDFVMEEEGRITLVLNLEKLLSSYQWQSL